MLTDKIAVVTGASRGIGMATTQALIDEGAHVVAGARETSTLLGMRNVTAVRVDLFEPDGPARLVQAAIDRHGRVDVLVNNVGAVSLRAEGFLAVTDEDFDSAYAMNVMTTLRASRATLPHMVAQGSGAIVNLASAGTYIGPGATIDSDAAKAAVRSITRALAHEFGPYGIRVNTVSVGPVDTDLWFGDHGLAAASARATGTDIDAAAATLAETMGPIATGRFTSAEEAATLIVMLASDRAANVTGADVVVDGGLHPFG